MQSTHLTIRPGGRSSRIVSAVFEAIEALLEIEAPEKLGIPAIAVQAKITPSTLYRRWGRVEALLVSYAGQRFKDAIAGLNIDSGTIEIETLAHAYKQAVCSPLGRYIAPAMLVPNQVRNRSEIWEIIYSAARAASTTSFGRLTPDDVMDYLIGLFVTNG